jgi:undecaprenyl-diphosphatase
MTILESLVLGVVEGVTEFLPISSTGHLILASSLLGIPQSDFTKSFEIAIQLGAILAVILLYWRSLLEVETLKRVVVAFIPTGVIGFALYHFLKSYLLGNTVIVVSSLFIGGVIFIIFERLTATREITAPAPLTYRQAFLVGVCQAIAIIPGVSRSGATIIGGLALGVKRTTIVEFSFLLAIPTMLAATGLDLLETSYWMFLGADL